jgi:hypothetical protein
VGVCMCVVSWLFVSLFVWVVHFQISLSACFGPGLVIARRWMLLAGTVCFLRHSVAATLP